MLQNEHQRLNIWLNQSNRFDYAEFTAGCTEVGILANDPMEFAQKVGIISVAIVTYPDLTPAEAYVKFVNDFNNPQPIVNIKPPAAITPVPESRQSAPMMPSPTSKKCGGCGGGRIL